LSPTWLDRSLFPFAGHWFDAVDGRMHYVDEGSGTPVVLIHGTPTWSFLYRDLIARLARCHRVIAVDHLGFGLSEKPRGAPYAPQDHCRRLVALLDALDVSEASLVLHDFGGPIGLGAALARPKRISRLVLFNTWCWSLHGDRAIARGAKLAASPIGHVLYRYFNVSVNVLMPKAVANREVLTARIHRQYRAALGEPDARIAAWECARALLGSSAWYDEIWADRERLATKPMLLLWGAKDPTFGLPYFDRWRRAFPAAEAHVFENSGHFVPEEAADAAGPLIQAFVR
jgi:haloalkane dehalogenase